MKQFLDTFKHCISTAKTTAACIRNYSSYSREILRSFPRDSITISDAQTARE